MENLIKPALRIAALAAAMALTGAAGSGALAQDATEPAGGVATEAAGTGAQVEQRAEEEAEGFDDWGLLGLLGLGGLAGLLRRPERNVVVEPTATRGVDTSGRIDR